MAQNWNKSFITSKIVPERLQWRIQGRDPGGARLSLIFLEQTGVQRAEKPLSQGRDDCLLPPPYLTVWIRHWGWVGGFDDPNPSLQSWILTSVLAGCK